MSDGAITAAIALVIIFVLGIFLVFDGETLKKAKSDLMQCKAKVHTCEEVSRMCFELRGVVEQ